jgi:hypothetical protein
MHVTQKNVLKWLEKARVATLTALAEQVAGEPIKGSWWGHPSGNDIYACANVLDDSGEVLTTKLIEGKVTFIHRALWAALYRVVTDAKTERTVKLDAGARKLLRAVEEAGSVRLDQLALFADRKTLSKAAKALESGLYVHGAQVHTERGKHETALETWERSKLAAVKKEAKKLALEDARATLREALGKAKVFLAL